MATVYGKKAKAPAFQPVNGGAVILEDSYSPTANFTAADQVNLVRIPAGTRVTSVAIQGDDLDTNGTPTIVFRVGYAPCDGSDPTADDDYFAVAGQTTLQAGGRLQCAFEPITFEKDVWLTVTVNTASATFAAGDIFGIVQGIALGPK